jgi:ATP adenylyltransferase
MQCIDDLKQPKSGCIFCEMLADGDDRERLGLYRGKTVFGVMNRYPYTNGHLLVVPYRHVGPLKDLQEDEYCELLKVTSQAVEIIGEKMSTDGFNCGFNLGQAAGAGIIEHIHMHVVPRWIGDTNFLPILSETRSMPEYLTETYDRLVDQFKAIGDRI